MTSSGKNKFKCITYKFLKFLCLISNQIFVTYCYLLKNKMISFLLWTQGESFLLILNKKKKEQGCAKDTKTTGFQKDKVRCRIDH